MGSKPATFKGSSKDRNHDEIVKTLREAGYDVAETHTVGNGFPDIVVGIPGFNGGTGLNLLMEIKSQTNWSLSEKQIKFFNKWGGLAFVVTTPAQALEICDYYRQIQQSPDFIELLNGYQQKA